MFCTKNLYIGDLTVFCTINLYIGDFNRVLYTGILFYICKILVDTRFKGVFYLGILYGRIIGVLYIRILSYIFIIFNIVSPFCH